MESSFDNLENADSKSELKNIVEPKTVFLRENEEINKKNIEEIKNEEKPKIIVEKKKVLKREESSVQTKKALKDNKSQKNKKVNLHSYKIIFILKEVDPKDPIKELSTILNNSKVNFEIEKIERFFEKKK